MTTSSSSAAASALRMVRVFAWVLAAASVSGPAWALTKANSSAAAADPAAAKSATITPVSAKTLYIEIQAPFVANAIHADDIEDALMGSVIEQLRHAKFTGKVEEAARTTVPAGAPVLTVHLMNWRTTVSGDIECRFTAEFRHADAQTELGWFDGRTSSIMRSRNQWFVGEDFVKAADAASASLVTTLKDKGLL